MRVSTLATLRLTRIVGGATDGRVAEWDEDEAKAECSGKNREHRGTSAIRECGWQRGERIEARASETSERRDV